MTNLLNFIDVHDLNDGEDVISFMYIDLHTKNKDEAISFCKKFFASCDILNEAQFFYTDSSNYSYYGGFCYKLSQDANTKTFWLVRQNRKKYEC